MDEIESSDFFLDPDSQDSIPEPPIDLGEEFSLDDNDLGNEEAESTLELSLEDALGPGPEIDEEIILEASSCPDAELDSDIDLGAETLTPQDAATDPGAELNLDESSDPEEAWDFNLDMVVEPEVELDLDIDLDVEPELGIAREVTLETEEELEIDLTLEPEIELDVEASPDPEPANDFEPELELTLLELTLDDMDISEAIETSAPPPSEEIETEPAEDSSDPFFSAYLDMADSSDDDDEEFDSLEEKQISALGDDDIDFINETQSRPVNHEDNRPEEAGRTQSSESAQEEAVVGNAGDTISGMLTKQNLKEIVKSTLDDSFNKELAGISESVMQTVQDVVKEVTPDIVRNIIQEEIDKIKKLEDV